MRSSAVFSLLLLAAYQLACVQAIRLHAGPAAAPAPQADASPTYLLPVDPNQAPNGPQGFFAANWFNPLNPQSAQYTQVRSVKSLTRISVGCSSS